MKEYKQGLLVEADVVDEIELYEEYLVNVEASISVPNTNVETPTAAVLASTDEINPATFKPSTTDGPRDDPPESEKVAKH